jgi:hypothetical protein
MNKETQQSSKNDDEKLISFSSFLESTPPNTVVKVKAQQYTYGKSDYINISEIELYCDSELCNGKRFFKSDKSQLYVHQKDFGFDFITFHCKNCQQTPKTYAIATIFSSSTTITAIKFGELPSFGPHTPAKLIELIGPDRDLFLTGRRSENQGMGIGAFAYYRRVVDSQKDRIIDQIIQVAKKIRASSELISDLESAKKQNSFSKAIESIKHTLPESLMIDGHNPLSLLYGALSEGVHEKTDEECLELAESIRIILAELANKISLALKDEAEVKGAITKLLNREK